MTPTDRVLANNKDLNAYLFALQQIDLKLTDAFLDFVERRDEFFEIGVERAWAISEEFCVPQDMWAALCQGAEEKVRLLTYDERK